MTTADKELLLSLVTRPGMYIYSVSADCIISFIDGYEIGTGNQCDFTEQLRHLLAGKYRMSHSSDGWPGQIRRLAKKRASTWVTTFRQLTLKIIAAAEGRRLTESQQTLLKNKITQCIKELSGTFGQSPNTYWVEEWQALCAVRKRWFRPLWTGPEWKMIQELDALVQAARVASAPDKQSD